MKVTTLCLSLCCMVAIAASMWKAPHPPLDAIAAKCVGADPCHACKTCRSCKYCKGGGTCGTCKPKKGERALAYLAEPLCK
jgi:hypothetical protein